MCQMCIHPQLKIVPENPLFLPVWIKSPINYCAQLFKQIADCVVLNETVYRSKEEANQFCILTFQHIIYTPRFDFRRGGSLHLTSGDLDIDSCVAFSQFCIFLFKWRCFVFLIRKKWENYSAGSFTSMRLRWRHVSFLFFFFAYPTSATYTGFYTDVRVCPCFNQKPQHDLLWSHLKVQEKQIESFNLFIGFVDHEKSLE